MAESEVFTLGKDRQGMIWDVLMYVPTVGGLAGVAFMFWFDGNQNLSYLLFFLACFFLYQGAHRIMQRLLVLPSSPVEMAVTKQNVRLKSRDGELVELVKDVRYFTDYAGKSFALAGMDMSGRKRQYVFHRGQFPDLAAYKRAGEALKPFA